MKGRFDPLSIRCFREQLLLSNERTRWVAPARRLGMALSATLILGGCATARGTSGSSTGSGVPELRQIADSMVSDAKFRNAHWGILIVDPDRGDTLYSHNAGKLFMPASNQKIITGAVALHLLGPNYRFATTFSTTGAIADGALLGDLVVTGTGDPSISDRMRGDAMLPLLAVADSLAARGVRRITGRLTTRGDAFPDATLGYGWSWDDLDFPYSAGVDELFFNEGYARLIVRGGRAAGDPATIETGPMSRFPMIVSRVSTVSAGVPATGDNALTVRHDSTAPGTVIVEGVVAAGVSDTLTIAFRDHEAAYLAALSEALVRRNVIVEGRPQTLTRAQSAGNAPRPSAGGDAPMEPAYQPLFTMYSPPLSDILPAFEKPSQNQIGEILLKTLGRERTGVGSADSGRRVVRSQLLAWGADSAAFIVRDGSGLSRYNVVSPETIVRTLAAIRRDSAFATFYASLPIAGVDGTIRNRMKGTRAQGNVHAKTGTIALARSLSGYVTTADGRMLIFSMLANNFTVPLREVERVQDVLSAHLADLRLDRR